MSEGVLKRLRAPSIPAGQRESRQRDVSPSGEAAEGDALGSSSRQQGDVGERGVGDGGAEPAAGVEAASVIRGGAESFSRQAATLLASTR